MSHSHSTDPTTRRPGSTGRRGRSEAARHQQALRILIVVLIPLGIWTFAGLIALWPKDVGNYIDHDVSSYSVPGVTYPTGQITAIQPVSCEGMAGSTPGVNSQTCANITVRVLDGDDTGKEVAGIPLTDALYKSGTKVGQRVKLIRIPPADGQPSQFQFSDFERRIPLAVITLVFAAAVIFVARWRGFASLLGLGVAGFILVKFMFPALVSGSNPVLVGLVGSSAIMFVVLYATHGFSARTSTALVGTLFGLVTAALLGWGATVWAHLSGVTSEDDYVLAASAPHMSLTSVVICGVIVAGLGVLNDVTITQASAVWELADNDPDQKRLFSKAMRIGRDHIASTVYTIAFATAGASLPVFLLIAIYDRPLLEVLQTESFAAELIRTMVGSIGLILAVPLTTAVGVAVVRASGRAKLPGFGRRKAVAAAAAAETSGSTESSADAGDADTVNRADSGDHADDRTTVIEGPATEDAVTTELAAERSTDQDEGDSAVVKAASTSTDSPDDAEPPSGPAADSESSEPTESPEPEPDAGGKPDADKTTSSDAATAPPRRTRLRRRRKSADDDLDFSDLRDPD